LLTTENAHCSVLPDRRSSSTQTSDKHGVRSPSPSVLSPAAYSHFSFGRRPLILLTVAWVRKKNLRRPHSATSTVATSVKGNRLSGPSLVTIVNLELLNTSMSTHLTTAKKTVFSALIVNRLAAPTRPLLTVAMALGLTIHKALCNTVTRDAQLIVFKTSAEVISEAKTSPQVPPSSATFAKATRRKPSQEVTARDTVAEVQE
jgi:hypothetical protein